MERHYNTNVGAAGAVCLIDGASCNGRSLVYRGTSFVGVSTGTPGQRGPVNVVVSGTVQLLVPRTALAGGGTMLCYDHATNVFSTTATASNHSVGYIINKERAGSRMCGVTLRLVAVDNPSQPPADPSPPPAAVVSLMPSVSTTDTIEAIKSKYGDVVERLRVNTLDEIIKARTTDFSAMRGLIEPMFVHALGSSVNAIINTLNVVERNISSDFTHLNNAIRDVTDESKADLRNIYLHTQLRLQLYNPLCEHGNAVIAEAHTCVVIFKDAVFELHRMVESEKLALTGSWTAATADSAATSSATSLKTFEAKIVELQACLQAVQSVIKSFTEVATVNRAQLETASTTLSGIWDAKQRTTIDGLKGMGRFAFDVVAKVASCVVHVKGAIIAKGLALKAFGTLQPLYADNENDSNDSVVIWSTIANTNALSPYLKAAQQFKDTILWFTAAAVAALYTMISSTENDPKDWQATLDEWETQIAPIKQWAAAAKDACKQLGEVVEEVAALFEPRVENEEGQNAYLAAAEPPLDHVSLKPIQAMPPTSPHYYPQSGVDVEEDGDEDVEGDGDEDVEEDGLRLHNRLDLNGDGFISNAEFVVAGDDAFGGVAGGPNIGVTPIPYEEAAGHGGDAARIALDAALAGLKKQAHDSAEAARQMFAANIAAANDNQTVLKQDIDTLEGKASAMESAGNLQTIRNLWRAVVKIKEATAQQVADITKAVHDNRKHLKARELKKSQQASEFYDDDNDESDPSDHLNSSIDSGASVDSESETSSLDAVDTAQNGLQSRLSAVIAKIAKLAIDKTTELGYNSKKRAEADAQKALAVYEKITAGDEELIGDGETLAPLRGKYTQLSLNVKRLAGIADSASQLVHQIDGATDTDYGTSSDNAAAARAAAARLQIANAAIASGKTLSAAAINEDGQTDANLQSVNDSLERTREYFQCAADALPSRYAGVSDIAGPKAVPTDGDCLYHCFNYGKYGDAVELNSTTAHALRGRVVGLLIEANLKSQADRLLDGGKDAYPEEDDFKWLVKATGLNLVVRGYKHRGDQLYSNQASTGTLTVSYNVSTDGSGHETMHYDVVSCLTNDVEDGSGNTMLGGLVTATASCPLTMNSMPVETLMETLEGLISVADDVIGKLLTDTGGIDGKWVRRFQLDIGTVDDADKACFKKINKEVEKMMKQKTVEMVPNDVTTVPDKGVVWLIEKLQEIIKKNKGGGEVLKARSNRMKIIHDNIRTSPADLATLKEVTIEAICQPDDEYDTTIMMKKLLVPSVNACINICKTAKEWCQFALHGCMLGSTNTHLQPVGDLKTLSELSMAKLYTDILNAVPVEAAIESAIAAHTYRISANKLKIDEAIGDAMVELQINAINIAIGAKHMFNSVYNIPTDRNLAQEAEADTTGALSRELGTQTGRGRYRKTATDEEQTMLDKYEDVHEVKSQYTYDKRLQTHADRLRKDLKIIHDQLAGQDDLHEHTKKCFAGGHLAITERTKKRFERRCGGRSLKAGSTYAAFATTPSLTAAKRGDGSPKRRAAGEPRTRNKRARSTAKQIPS